VDLAQSAALMKVVSTIYNMEEAITKTWEQTQPYEGSKFS
jgi:hypothetical protein